MPDEIQKQVLDKLAKDMGFYDWEDFLKSSQFPTDWAFQIEDAISLAEQKTTEKFVWFIDWKIDELNDGVLDTSEFPQLYPEMCFHITQETLLRELRNLKKELMVRLEL